MHLDYEKKVWRGACLRYVCYFIRPPLLYGISFHMRHDVLLALLMLI